MSKALDAIAPNHKYYREQRLMQIAGRLGVGVDTLFELIEERAMLTGAALCIDSISPLH